MHRLHSQAPHLSRRGLFGLLGAGLTGAYLPPRLAAQTPVPGRGRARQVIFILLTGAPSHVDTFDLKFTDGITPAAFDPTSINGLLWPMGLFPSLATRLPHLAIVRSVRAWALVHPLAQIWSQIGRSPAAALGSVAPNMGSIVALEKEPERNPGQVFPAFLALNADGAVGSGYLSTAYAPFKTTPATSGLPNTTNSDGQLRSANRLKFLHTLDDALRVDSPLGAPLSDYDAFYTAASGLTFNPVVSKAFSYTAADSARYGSSSFGNACLVARQVLAANQGTRFLQINYGNWDMHSDIYGARNPNGNNLFTVGRPLDNGLATLLGDLESDGLLSETLIVLTGEFGRTVGALSADLGRDHFPQQFALFAGAGVRGGRALGSTLPDGSDVAGDDYGWKQNRYVRPEDIEATIYAALGIDWTRQIDTPFGRSFEYVPGAAQGLYAPIDELWA